jgi:putrescine transport system permease protein
MLRALKDKILLSPWGSTLLIFIPYFWLFLFFVLPFLIILKISFSEPILAMPPYTPFFEWRSGDALDIHLFLGNYRVVLGDILYITALWQSIKLAFLATVITLVIGYPLAYAITRCAPKWQNILILLIFLPFWTSFLLRVYAWMGILSPSGILVTCLNALGLFSTPVSLLHSTFAICLGMVYCYLPFMVLPIYAHLQKFDYSLVEAAADLGCRSFKIFFRVILPLSKKGILTGCLLVFIPAAGEFVIPELLGGSDTLMIGKVLWIEFFSNRDWPMAATIAIFLLVVLMIPLVFLQPKSSREG